MQKIKSLEKCKPKRLSLGLLTIEKEKRGGGKELPQLRRLLLDV
jgi:hypothetical protein